jgi:hypothetical protein
MNVFGTLLAWVVAHLLDASITNSMVRTPFEKIMDYGDFSRSYSLDVKMLLLCLKIESLGLKK